MRAEGPAILKNCISRDRHLFCESAVAVNPLDRSREAYLITAIQQRWLWMCLASKIVPVRLVSSWTLLQEMKACRLEKKDLSNNSNEYLSNAQTRRELPEEYIELDWKQWETRRLLNETINLSLYSSIGESFCRGKMTNYFRPCDI